MLIFQIFSPFVFPSTCSIIFPDATNSQKDDFEHTPVFTQTSPAFRTDGYVSTTTTPILGIQSPLPISSSLGTPGLVRFPDGPSPGPMGVRTGQTVSPAVQYHHTQSSVPVHSLASSSRWPNKQVVNYSQPVVTVGSHPGSSRGPILFDPVPVPQIAPARPASRPIVPSVIRRASYMAHRPRGMLKTVQDSSRPGTSIQVFNKPQMHTEPVHLVSQGLEYVATPMQGPPGQQVMDVGRGVRPQSQLMWQPGQQSFPQPQMRHVQQPVNQQNVMPMGMLQPGARGYRQVVQPVHSFVPGAAQRVSLPDYAEVQQQLPPDSPAPSTRFFSHAQDEIGMVGRLSVWKFYPRFFS